MKLSIIIPIYNGEKHIKKMLDMLLENSIEKEIIVINDCSNDNSKKILDEYKERINLHHLSENHGVSYARNYGLSIAKGEYISFIDIDDEIEEEMLSKMLQKIENTNSDICVCNYYEIFETNDKKIASKYKLNYDVLAKEEVIKEFLLDHVSPAVWDKIYKKSLLDKIKFNENLAIGEDILFCLYAFMESNKVAFINEYFYKYTQNNYSAMHKLSNKLLQFKEVIKSIDFDKYKYLDETYYEEFSYFKSEMITRGIHSISVLANKHNKKEIKKFLANYCDKKDLDCVIRNKYVKKTIKLEILILRYMGMNVHLLLMPIYKFVRNKR